MIVGSQMEDSKDGDVTDQKVDVKVCTDHFVDDCFSVCHTVVMCLKS